MMVMLANSLTEECLDYSAMSFMQIRKKIDRSTEPCSTPEVIYTSSDASLSTTTSQVLPQRKDLDHRHIAGSIPYMCSLWSSLEQPGVRDFVKSFSKVHHNHITQSIAWVSVESLDMKPCQWLYRMLFMVICCIAWLAKMCSIHLQDTCEGNRVVVGCLVLLSFLEYWGFICSLPVSRYLLMLFGSIVDEDYYLGQNISKPAKNA